MADRGPCLCRQHTALPERIIYPGSGVRLKHARALSLSRAGSAPVLTQSLKTNPAPARQGARAETLNLTLP